MALRIATDALVRSAYGDNPFPSRSNGSSNSGGTSRSSVSSGSNQQLTDDQQKQLEKLKTRDAEVRQHELAHIRAGGQYVTGGPTYDYQRGPDNKLYAIGGNVQIDVSPVEGDPEATIRKAQQVKAAALAPSDPSPEDLQVAAKASELEQKAQSELKTKSGSTGLKGLVNNLFPGRSNKAGNASSSQDSASQSQSSTSAESLNTPSSPSSPTQQEQRRIAAGYSIDSRESQFDTVI